MQWTLSYIHKPSHLLEASQLERQIMRLLLAYGACNLRQLHRCLSLHQTVDYVAVVAAVKRLVRDGVLVPEVPPSGHSESADPLARHGDLTLLQTLVARRSAFERPALLPVSPVIQWPMAFMYKAEVPLQRAIGE